MSSPPNTHAVPVDKTVSGHPGKAVQCIGLPPRRPRTLPFEHGLRLLCLQRSLFPLQCLSQLLHKR